MGMPLIGGPVDGEIYNGETDINNPYIVLECRAEEHQIFAMYRLEDDKLYFIEAKTLKDLEKEQ